MKFLSLALITLVSIGVAEAQRGLSNGNALSGRPARKLQQGMMEADPEQPPLDTCSEQKGCFSFSVTESKECGSCGYLICMQFNQDLPNCEKTGTISHTCTDLTCSRGVDINLDSKLDPFGNLDEMCHVVGAGESASFIVKDGSDCVADIAPFPVPGGGTATCGEVEGNPIECSAGGPIEMQCLWTITAPTENPDCGGVEGDPHFMTWVGEYFDYMGECDLVLAQSKTFGNGIGFAAHIRAKARFDYTYVESAAIQIGDDVLEVSGYGAFMLNGISNAELPFMMADKYLVTKSVKNDHDITFEIEVSKDKHIHVKAFKDLVSVRFMAEAESDFKDVVGIMGDIKGTRLSRDGLTIMEDMDAYGQEWMVHPEIDGELFQVKSTSKECRLPSAVKDGRRRLGESISVEEATKACQKHKSTRAAMEACIYDVIAMGDLSVAEAGVY